MTDPDSIVQSIKTFLETDTGDDTQKNELKQKLGELIPNVEQASSSGIKQITDTLYKLKLSQASKIPRYKKDENFSRYCERFQEFIYLSKVTDPNLYLYFLQHLDDETYSILKAVTIPDTGDYKSNPKLFCELYKTAIYGDTSITLKNEVLECKQKSDETVSDFVYRLRSKASIAYTNLETANETCLSAILRGLKDPQMKRKLNEDTTIKTFEDAIKLAKRLEQINKMLDNDTVQIEPILKETAMTTISR